MDPLSSLNTVQNSSEDGLFQALFDSEDAAFLYMLDSTGLPRSLSRVNDAACSLLGYTRAEMLAAPQGSFAKFRGAARAAQLLNNLHNRRQVRFQSELTTASGTPITVEVTALLLSYAGQPAALVICRSIEPIKRKEKLLRIIKRRYSTIIQDQTEIIVRFIPTGSLTFINQAGLRAFGLRTANALKSNIFSMLPVGSATILKEHLASLTRLAPVRMVDFRIRKATGEEAEFEWTSRAIFDSWGVIEYQLVGRDVTTFIQAKEALLASEENFRDLVENISDVIWETDANNHIVYLSPRCQEVTGYSASELIGKTGFDALLWADTDTMGESADKAPPYLPFHRERELRHKDGHTIVLEIRANPIHDEKSTFCGYRGTARDITFRKELERELISHRNNLESLVRERTIELKTAHEQLQRELVERLITNTALRESEEQLRTLINAIPDVVCLKDGEGRWLECNQYARDILGLGDTCCEGLTDKDLAQVVPVNRTALEHFYSTDQLTWAAGTICSYEDRLSAGDGTERIFETIKVPVYYPGGERKGMLVIGRDITERQRALEIEKELEAERSRMERLNLVGEMAVNIGHEIRNPMTTVRGYLQLMLSRPAFCQYRAWLNLMIHDLDKANSIITNFISLAKNKAIRLACCDLNKLISDVLPEITVWASAEQKSVTASLGDIPLLMLDDKEIRQLLHNLVKNGLEVTPPNESLEVNTYCMGDLVVLEVADKGPGFPEHLLDRLGTPFLSTKESGTGLGLAVCYHIADRHGARLKILTGAAGTRVCVYFKRKEQ